jgi:hypothetical protein
MTGVSSRRGPTLGRMGGRVGWLVDAIVIAVMVILNPVLGLDAFRHGPGRQAAARAAERHPPVDFHPAAICFSRSWPTSAMPPTSQMAIDRASKPCPARSRLSYGNVTDFEVEHAARDDSSVQLRIYCAERPGTVDELVSVPERGLVQRTLKRSATASGSNSRSALATPTIRSRTESGSRCH